MLDFIKEINEGGFPSLVSEEDIEINNLIWRTPRQCYLELRNKVIEIRKTFLSQIEISPEFLYFVLETEDHPPRAFPGRYLLDPAIFVPSSDEVREQMVWTEKQFSRSRRRMVDEESVLNKRKKFGVDDLYEAYLRMAINKLRTYSSDVQNHIMYGSEVSLFVIDRPSVFLLMILDREKKGLGRLNQMRADYIRRSAPVWMFNLVEIERRRKVQLIQLIERKF